MVRPPKEFLAVAKDYVCVRIIDMRDVDLNVYRFDYDLTLAALLMHADGTVYHRYGGRDRLSSVSWMSMNSLVRVMRETLPEHRAYHAAPQPRQLAEPRTVMDIEPFARRVKGKDVDCVHCHNLHEAERALAQEEGRWTRKHMWVWPNPDRVGLIMDKDSQALIADVPEAGPAWVAGLRETPGSVPWGREPG